MANKNDKRIRLKKKIRSKIAGTAMRPRLSVFRSNKFIYAQIIDDNTRKTLASANDAKITKGTKMERAREVGSMIAKVCKDLKIESVVFDRNGFIYHGRVQSLAEGAREGGLNF